MTGPTIRLAERADAPRLNAALQKLSQTMGDTHRADDLAIAEAGFGKTPAFYAELAEEGDQIVGVAVYSPLFSTVRGKAGVYVSDLWVDEAARGQRLGVRLLEAVRDDAKARWGAGFLRLVVYDDNPRAVSFYAGLGFRSSTGETVMTLEDSALTAMGENL
jgi:ribosomal protein S18 acetylase RimI-like enzyme